jgi:hypothetical protein
MIIISVKLSDLVLLNIKNIVKKVLNKTTRLFDRLLRPPL